MAVVKTMSDNSIQVISSADSAPSDPSVTAPPAEQPGDPATPAIPAEPAAPALYELPDGRKVDGETLTKEWKDNFLPDYTKKSQTLAEMQRSTPPISNPDPATVNKYADPNYVPQTYEEILQEAEQRALRSFEARETARTDQQLKIESEVSTQLSDIKKGDPSLNENDLFAHATKYGFRDLRVAHQNMRDMSELAKKVQTTTAQNIARRADPVSVQPGANGVRQDPSSFSSATEYLRSLKN